MANKYSGAEIIYTPCGNPKCDRQVRTTPSQRKKGKRYCSQTCACKMKNVAKKYTGDALQWIIDNIRTTPPKDMAAHFGVTASALRKAISLLRKTNKIPMGLRKRKAKKVKKSPGKDRLLIFQPKAKKAAKKNYKPPVKPAIKATPRMEKVFATREHDLRGKIEVVINDKTRVFVTDQSQVEKVKEKYAHLMAKTA